jgi:hypothetical protein
LNTTRTSSGSASWNSSLARRCEIYISLFAHPLSMTRFLIHLPTTPLHLPPGYALARSEPWLSWAIVIFKPISLFKDPPLRSHLRTLFFWPCPSGKSPINHALTPSRRPTSAIQLIDHERHQHRGLGMNLKLLCVAARLLSTSTPSSNLASLYYHPCDESSSNGATKPHKLRKSIFPP